MKLSPEQLLAVQRTGQEVCVVAGPGSGKTRVLVERFAWLVEACSVPPDRILAITFTEKAATEMKERLVVRFKVQPEHREAVERAWVSTIDGFCHRLLRENAIDAGLPPDFSVLDAPAAKQILREAAEAALDGLYAERPAELRRLMEALDLATDPGTRNPDLAESMCQVYEKMRLAGLRELPRAGDAAGLTAEARQIVMEIGRDPGFAYAHDWAERFLALPDAPISIEHFRLLADWPVKLNSGKKSRPAYQAAGRFNKEIREPLAGEWAQMFYHGLPELFREAVARMNLVFREVKRQQGVVDFADLEEQAILVLESRPEVRARLTGQFDHVLMDELQDTNRLQWRLVNQIRKNFFAVGDINQSIYGFRHADPTVFEEYRNQVRAAGGTIDELSDNYRSRRDILEAVDQVLGRQEGIEPRELKPCRKAEPIAGPMVYRVVGKGQDGEAIEAETVAARIAELAGTSGDFSQFAILIRTMAAADAFEKALEKRGIPFLVSGGRTFLESREIRDLLNLLAALVNPLDDVALLGVLRGPLMGWSDEEILRQGREGGLAEFERRFGAARRLAGFVPPDRLLAKALDECGYRGALSSRERANVEKLLDWIRREHRRRPRPLAELLETLEALREAHSEADAPPPEAANAVSILSIHNAKGLEFPVVFVGGLHRGPETRKPPILFSAERGPGMKWRNPATGAGAPDPVYRELSERQSAEEKREEHRLLYVAMTRAEHRLILSYAEKKRNATSFMKLAESIAEAEAGTSPEHAEPQVHAAPRQAVEFLEKPELAAQYDSSLSATSAALFEACPRKYYLSRYLGLDSEPQGPGTGAVDLGLEVHRVLSGKASESEEANALAARFLESELGRRAGRAARIEREFDFLLALDDVVLRGQIDLWFEEGGELVLVDYKTDRSEVSASEYSLQLKLYALALERYAGRVPDRAVLCYLRSGKVVEVGLAPEELRSARQAVQALSTAQDRLEFPMKPGEQCLRCGFYKGICASSGPSSGPPSSVPEPPTNGS